MIDERIIKIKESADFILSKIHNKVEFAIILGSGLGKLADKIENPIVIPYATIPHFVQSTAIGHSGNLIFGTFGKHFVIAMQGRFHYYEGYTMEEVTFPIRVFYFLGVKKIIVSNAAGGCNVNYKMGDIMLIKDHINLAPNPLIGKNMDELGPRFPDMTHAYNTEMLKMFEQVATEQRINYHKGVYVCLTGASFETPAEYEFIRRIGGDAVGMSTVAEVIVAKHCGIEVVGFSVITNEAYAFTENFKNSHQDVVKVADKAADILTNWVRVTLETRF